MRRFIVAALLVGAFLAVAGAGTANAATRWPARCTNFKCVNAHLNQLHSQIKQTRATLNGFLNCTSAFPATEYSDYLASDGTTSITALDYTASGDSVDAWLVGIPGGKCGYPAMARVAHGLKSALPAPLLTFYRP
jgi:hypothetical protein